MSKTSQAAIDAVITDEVKSWIGRSTDLLTVPDPVATSDVRRYMDATGDRNPIWSDDAAAQAVGYRARVVPPMMVIDLAWRLNYTESGRFWVKVPLPADYVDTRNADTDIEWLAPVYIGDQISIRHRIVDIVARQGRRGLGVYITRETDYTNQDSVVVARVRATAVRFAKARLETPRLETH